MWDICEGRPMPAHSALGNTNHIDVLSISSRPGLYMQDIKMANMLTYLEEGLKQSESSFLVAGRYLV